MRENLSNVYKNSIGKAILKKNIPYLRLANNGYFQAGYGYKQKRFAFSDVNSGISSIMSQNKELTNELLKKCSIPIPRGVKLEEVKNLKEEFEKLKKPVVIKPTKEMWGKGVTTNIKTLKEAQKAFKIAFDFNKKVILEEQVQGEDYRVLIINNKFIAALKRMKPYIIGDGKKNIENLIEEENKKRERSLKCIKKILFEETVNSALKEQGYNLKSVPEKGKKVSVRMTGNLSSGGISENVTDKVCQENIDIAKKAACYLDLDIAGIDFITTDITRPLKETHGAIVEVNQNPGVDVHEAPYIGKPIMSSEILVDYMILNKKDIWINIWLNGKKVKDKKTVNKNLYTIPESVKQFLNKHSKKIIEIKNPCEKLYNYLIDPLTYEVVIK